jgi:hypothetical protein
MDGGVCVDPRCVEVALAARPPSGLPHVRPALSVQQLQAVRPMPQLQTLALPQLHQKQIAVGGPILAGRICCRDLPDA